ncbi:endonuclease/exonuclease/phosphatase family protein [Halomonas sp. 18H]|uniref:endonuclease/exonuclease/phosphatase family protein n=1 Tax=Halomonas almeriensis TaxID=308163 RepID=UPI0022317F72|nr:MULTISPECIES: endonuclease/exonuclease/phosphatase family protein [Halomonas]MCW4151161.1 endonuclease/exonuclease/phosphatase family protein [Halomonas sp. 18H]MDN3553041.1 endonuclease/exonuclease/phosphatase family protein [Halomonas almeriensis]
MTSILISIVAALLLAVTLVARLPMHWWGIRSCEFPRLQIAALALLCVVATPLVEPPWHWLAMVCGLVTLMIQVVHILPWTRLWPVQVKAAQPGHEDRCLRLLVANVLTPNRHAADLIAMIRHHQPDIILTLESDAWWEQQLDEALADDWPDAVRIPQDNLYGMHLYSRLPLLSPRVERLIQEDIPSISTGVQLRCGDNIHLHAVHPRPPAPSESKESLWRDAELLLVGKRIHADPGPTLVAGDLNDVAWSRTTRSFCRVSGMLDPRRGRGMFSTFHTSYPLLRWPLDHVFSSEHFTLRDMQRLPGFGSDHFPILTTLCYRPSRADEHDNPEADRQEHRDARDTIREGQRKEQED